MEVTYRNLERIDAYLDDRPLQESVDVKRSPHVAQLVISIGEKKLGSAIQLRLEGFRSNPDGLPELVAATRLDL